MMSYTDMKIFNPEKTIKSWCILLRLSSCPPCSFFPSWSSRYHPHHYVHHHHVHRHHVHHKPFSLASFSSFPSLFGFFGGLWLAAGGLKINFDQSKKNINYKSSFGGKIKKNLQRPDGTSWTWEAGVAGGGGFERLATCRIVRVFPRVKWHTGKNTWKYTKQLSKIYSR